MFKISLSLLFSFFLFSAISYGQIESGNSQPTQPTVEKTKKSKPKKEKIIRTDEDEAERSFFGFGAGAFFSQPIIRETHNLFSQSLGLKAQEKGMTVPYVSFNYKAKLAKSIYLGFGIDYSQSAERFNWKSTVNDSAYYYENHYQLVSVPIGLHFVVGKKVQFIGGFGLAPQLVFGSKQKLTSVTVNGSENKSKIQLRDHLNDFNLDTYVQAGIQYKVVNGFYLYLLPEFRYSLFNTIDKQGTYSRKYWQIGAQIGFALTF